MMTFDSMAGDGELGGDIDVSVDSEIVDSLRDRFLRGGREYGTVLNYTDGVNLIESIVTEPNYDSGRIAGNFERYRIHISKIVSELDIPRDKKRQYQLGVREIVTLLYLLLPDQRWTMPPEWLKIYQAVGQQLEERQKSSAAKVHARPGRPQSTRQSIAETPDSIVNIRDERPDIITTTRFLFNVISGQIAAGSSVNLNALWHIFPDFLEDNSSNRRRVVELVRDGVIPHTENPNNKQWEVDIVGVAAILYLTDPTNILLNDRLSRQAHEVIRQEIVKMRLSR